MNITEVNSKTFRVECDTATNFSKFYNELCLHSSARSNHERKDEKSIILMNSFKEDVDKVLKLNHATLNTKK